MITNENILKQYKLNKLLEILKKKSTNRNGKKKKTNLKKKLIKPQMGWYDQ